MNSQIRQTTWTHCDCKDGCTSRVKCPCIEKFNFCRSYDPDAPTKIKNNYKLCCCIGCKSRHSDWDRIKIGFSDRIKEQGLFATGDFETGEIVCQLVGDFGRKKINGNIIRVSLNTVAKGLGKFVYQVYANHKEVITLTCDRDHPSSMVNHSCRPNAKFCQVIQEFR